LIALHPTILIMGKRSKRRKVKRKLQLSQSQKKISHHNKQPFNFRNNLGDIISAIELVFPIVEKNEDGSYTAIGTGFFIHPAGGFVTAKHCLPRDVKTTEYFGIHTISPGHHEFVK